MASVCAGGFVEALFQNRLLEPEQQQELTGWPRFSEPRQLAQELIRRGWLTPFQANQLFLKRGADLLLGQYILLERLGQGGMGQVFKARQRNLNRIVALKVIRQSFLENPKAIPRFVREIQASAQLSHPHIVRAIDAGEADGTLFFAMEFINGIDLNRLVRRSGPLGVAQACDYIRQAALGLQHAHEQGMVHRDIKPANLLVIRPGANNGPPPRGSGLLLRPGSGPAPWGIVKILDLGLARWRGADHEQALASHLTQLGVVMGTPDYLAPEQACNSHTSDIRADLYSLGCTFYFLLAGRLPFPTGSLSEKLVYHQFHDPEPVDQVRHDRLLRDLPSGAAQVQKLVEVPDEVSFVVRWLMAKQPEDRCQTPAELAAALTTWLKNRPC